MLSYVVCFHWLVASVHRVTLPPTAQLQPYGSQESPFASVVFLNDTSLGVTGLILFVLIAAFN